MDSYEYLAIKAEYEHNSEFKEYVDKYCKKHHKTVNEALQETVPKNYLDYLLEK